MVIHICVLGHSGHEKRESNILIVFFFLKYEGHFYDVSIYH